MSSVHLRAGDVRFLADIYTNREVPSVALLATALKDAWARRASSAPSSRTPKSMVNADGHVVYLATDDIGASTVASQLRARLNGADVLVSQRIYRTAHGSHAAAFSRASLDRAIEMTLPFEIALVCISPYPIFSRLLTSPVRDCTGVHLPIPRHLTPSHISRSRLRAGSWR